VSKEKCSGVCPSTGFKLQQKISKMTKHLSMTFIFPYRFNLGSNKLLLMSLAALSIMRIKINILWSMSMFRLDLYLALKNAAKCVNSSWCTVLKRLLHFCQIWVCRLKTILSTHVNINYFTTEDSRFFFFWSCHVDSLVCLKILSFCSPFWLRVCLDFKHILTH